MTRTNLPLTLAALLAAATALAGSHADDFTTDVFTDECTFSPIGSSLFFFSLNPGDHWNYAGDEDGEQVELRVTVTHSMQRIAYEDESGHWRFVWTRVIEERESKDGELVEVSRNFYARCRETGAIYYFGEEVDIYEDGEIVSHPGAWRAGVDGALPGIIMPGTFLLNSSYYQETAPGVALDRAEHVAMGLEMELPAGTFERCVQVTETTPLEPGHESIKFYCPDVGLVVDGVLELTSYRRR